MGMGTGTMQEAAGRGGPCERSWRRDRRLKDRLAWRCAEEVASQGDPEDEAT